MAQNVKPKASIDIPWSAIIKAFGVLTSLIPMLTAMIEKLEEKDASGTDKKAAALAFLQSLLSGAGQYTQQLSADVVASVMSMAGVVVDAIVAAYNACKLFVHKAT